jgi:hypothetical protein
MIPGGDYFGLWIIDDGADFRSVNAVFCGRMRG